MNITPRKRKQPSNDSSTFLTPSIPAKRSAPLTMFFPKLTPPDSSVVMHQNNNSKLIQADSLFSNCTSSQHLDLEQEKLTNEIDQLRSAKLETQRQYESTIETIKRCLLMTRSLLVEKSQLEKKQARHKAMENRLRLGQFVTQRQGTSFVEQWVDGSDFLDKQRAQEQLARAKENLDKERKNLIKKKALIQQQMVVTTPTTDDMNQIHLQDSIFIPPTKPKRASKVATNKTFTKSAFFSFNFQRTNWFYLPLVNKNFSFHPKIPTMVIYSISMIIIFLTTVEILLHLHHLRH